MKIEIDQKYHKKLFVKKKEFYCATCGKRDKKGFWHYCETNKCLYCRQCSIKGHAQGEHEDLFINEIVMQDEVK